MGPRTLACKTCSLLQRVHTSHWAFKFTYVAKEGVLWPYAGVNDANHHARTSVCVPPSCLPQRVREVKECWRACECGSHHPAGRHGSHQRMAAQRSHVRGGQAGGEAVEDQVVAGWGRGGRGRAEEGGRGVEELLNCEPAITHEQPITRFLPISTESRDGGLARAEWG